MSIRAVIFDVYGTLLEVGPPPPDADAQWERLCRAALGTGPPLSRRAFAMAIDRLVAGEHETARARGIPWPEIHWPTVMRQALPALAALPREQQDEFVFRHVQTGHHTCMTPDAADALRWVRSRPCRAGIASNAQAYTVRELREALAPHGLDLGLFEPELCFWSYEHGFSKPDPHVFQLLSFRLLARGIHPGETLMVGDRLDNDVAPARAHGWRTWHWGAEGDGNGADLARALGTVTPPTAT